MFAEFDQELSDLQEKGEAPLWMRPRGFHTLRGNVANKQDNGYLYKNETPKDLYLRLAKAAAKELDRPDLESKFFELMWKGWYGPSSPVLANFGLERGLAIACYSAFCPDDMEGIIDHDAEVSMLGAKGGGVATHLSDIRPIGSAIGSGGKAKGILLPLAKLAGSIGAISQNGLRRGAIAAYLDIEHPDAEVFMRIRRPEVDEEHRFLNMNHGVVIKDSFFERCKNKDPKALELWNMLLTTRKERGEPYIFFHEAAQRDNPSSYAKLGLQVNSSNLCCLEANQHIITKEGVFPISALLDKEVCIWDGLNWTPTVFEYKGKTNSLVKIDFIDDSFIRATKNHRFYLKNGEVKLARDLETGDLIEKVDYSLLGDLYADRIDKRVESMVGKVTFIEVKAEPVYCCTVSTTGKFALADGRMSGNSEIMLANSVDYTFVCCLGSMNLAKYDEWHNTDAVRLSIYFLDAVMSEFIRKTEDNKHLKKAREFSIKSRAIGLGVLGYHTYLQSKSIAFESEEAFAVNKSIFEYIQCESQEASSELAVAYGSPEWAEPGERATHLNALAPTRSNSAICGSVSRSIEPLEANIGKDFGAKGNLDQINYELLEVLEKYNAKTDLILASIASNGGSVQHLNFLTAHEKAVYKTAREIDQAVIIRQAADRGKYIDQGQSLNLFYNAEADPKVIHAHHMLAKKLGLKSLYYLKSNSAVQASRVVDYTDAVNQIKASNLTKQSSTEGCAVCEG